jgi:hypothetical protein
MFRTLAAPLNMHLFLPLSSRGRLGWGCSLFCDFILIDRIICLLETTAYLVEMLFARDVFLSPCTKLRKDRTPFCFKTLHRGNKHSSFPCSCVGMHKGFAPHLWSQPLLHSLCSRYWLGVLLFNLCKSMGLFLGSCRHD